MRNLTALLFITFLFSAGCEKTEEPCSSFSLAISNISNQEEYLIVEAIVDHQSINSDLIHISQESQSISDSSNFAKYFESDELDFESIAIEEYIQLNSTSFVWGEVFEKELELISKEEVDCLFDNNADGWKAYYSKYENFETILNFGRPIQHGDRAIITYEYLCGWECSSGYTVTLQKIEDEWIVEKHIVVWIS